MEESFWQKDSLITHFELCLFRNSAQCTFFSPHPLFLPISYVQVLPLHSANMLHITSCHIGCLLSCTQTLESLHKFDAPLCFQYSNCFSGFGHLPTCRTETEQKQNRNRNRTQKHQSKYLYIHR